MGRSFLIPVEREKLVSKLRITEKRFIEGTPETRYMKDGVTVRCQCTSKTRLNELRQARNDLSLTPNKAWPDAQCRKSAFPNKLMCEDHGGLSDDAPDVNPFMWMPTDLAEKVGMIINNPHLLSRRLELSQLVARNMQLFEMLKEDEEEDGESAVLTGSQIDSLIKDLNDGKVVEVKNRLLRLLERQTLAESVRGEWLQNVAMIKDLTKTEIGTLQSLQNMYTTEQMLAFASNVADDLKLVLAENLDDRITRQRIIGLFAEAIKQRLGLTAGSLLGSANR
jgi:hypothetical protein